MAQPAQERGFWTFDDLADLADDRRHEVVDGVLLVMSPPTTRHDMIGGERYRQVATFTEVAELTAPFPLRVDLATLG